MGNVSGAVYQWLVGVAVLFYQDLLKNYLTSCSVLTVTFKVDQSHQKYQTALEALCEVFVRLEILITVRR